MADPAEEGHPAEAAVPGRQPPLTFAIDGERLEVLRSWPDGHGRRLFECRDAAGRIRAARIREDQRLTVLPYAQDPKLPTLRPAGELLVHRAGKRAVTRTGDGYVKHLRRDRAAGVAAATRTMTCLAGQAGFAVPEVIDVAEHSVTVSPVPGRALLSLDDDRWDRAWVHWAELWPRLIAGSPVPGGGERLDESAWDVHDAHAEAGVVATWFAHLRSFDAGGLASTCAAPLAEVEERVGAELRSDCGSPRTAPVIAHRDLHDGQMLYSPDSGRLGMLDFDTAVLADRELDLANLDVHIDLRVTQGLLGFRRAAAAHSAISRAAVAVGADEALLDVYRRAAQARLVSVYAFRPQWVAVAATLLAGLAAS